MRTPIFYIVIATLMLAAFFTSCESESQKEGEVKQELKETNQDAAFTAQKEDIAKEWKAFKEDVEEKIAKNDQRIAELKVKLKKTGRDLDKAYVKRIETLEQKNRDLRTRISNFDSHETNWQSFKREFNQDLDDLGKALKDFTQDNNK